MSESTHRSRFAALWLVSTIMPMASGCGLLGERKPTASVVGVQFQDIDLTSATMLFDVKVDNPYDLPLPLVNVDYDLKSKELQFLSGKAELQGSIPANGNKTVQIPAKVVFLDVLKIVQGVQPGQVVPYDAAIGLSVDAPVIGAWRIPVSKKGELPVPTAPQVQVSQIKWDNLSLDQAGGTVSLHVTNTNQFPLNLSQLQYALSLGGVEVANSTITKAVRFAASGGEGDLQIPLSFSPRSMGLAAFRLLSGQSGGYKLGGTMTVDTPFGPMNLPVDKAGSAAFHR